MKTAVDFIKAHPPAGPDPGPPSPALVEGSKLPRELVCDEEMNKVLDDLQREMIVGQVPKGKHFISTKMSE